MSRQNTVSRVEEFAASVGQSEGVEIVEVELKGSGRKQLLRVFIDKPGGVTHGDCERVSQRLSGVLDQDDVIAGQYTLEVSSPGVERKLKKLEDFTRFQGQKARLVVKKEDGKKQFVEGTLAGVEAGTIVVATRDGEERIPFESLDRANLKFEW